MRQHLAVDVCLKVLIVLIGKIPRIASAGFGRPVGGDIRVFPVSSQGIIETEFQSLLTAFVGQFFHRVACKRGTGNDVVIAACRVIHGKSVMVLGGDDDIFHAGFFGSLYPFSGVELGRVEVIGN